MILLDTKVLSEAMRVEPDGRVTLVGRTRRSDEIVQRESCGREPGAESPGGAT